MSALPAVPTKPNLAKALLSMKVPGATVSKAVCNKAACNTLFCRWALQAKEAFGAAVLEKRVREAAGKPSPTRAATKGKAAPTSPGAGFAIPTHPPPTDGSAAACSADAATTAGSSRAVRQRTLETSPGRSLVSPAMALRVEPGVDLT